MKQVFTVVWGLAKAVPQIYKLINEFFLMWQKHAIEQIERPITSRKLKTDAVIKAISKSETSEERRALSIILHDLVNGK
jgi:hypothetical protein